MKLNILNAVFAGIGCVAAVATAIDQIANANKRAYIIGDTAGRAAVDETEKRSKKTIFGTVIKES